MTRPQVRVKKIRHQDSEQVPVCSISQLIQDEQTSLAPQSRRLPIRRVRGAIPQLSRGPVYKSYPVA